MSEISGTPCRGTRARLGDGEPGRAQWQAGRAVPIALLAGLLALSPVARSADDVPDSAQSTAPKPSQPAEPAIESVSTPLGTVRLIRPDDVPKGLLLYLGPSPDPRSGGGDGGGMPTSWRTAADQDYVVAVPSPDILQRPAAGGACWDLAGDLQRLAEALRAQLGLPAGTLPILLGEGEGATLAYAALVQSRPHTFHAVLTRDFCPSVPLPPALCDPKTPDLSWRRDGQALPVPRVGSAWFAIAPKDSGCPADTVAAFVDRVDNARLLAATPAAREPSAAEAPATAPPDRLEALLQWLDPRIADQVGADSAGEDLAGLSLTEVPAQGAATRILAVMLSGDGGWAQLDRGLSAELAAHGIATVGWDSLAYYWKARTPDEATRDLARILRHYLDAWDKDRVLLIGYSFGADVLPFIANRLTPDLRANVDLIALLGLSPTATFEFHLNDWFSSAPTGDSLPVAPELARMGWTRGLCIYGADEDEDDSLCPRLADPAIAVHKVPGDHHFEHNYSGLADIILAALGPAPD